MAGDGVSPLRALRTLAYLRPEQIVRRLWTRAFRPWYASAFYDRYVLGAGSVAEPRRFPPALWPGDGENGRRILEGQIRLVGQERPFPVPPDWSARDRSLLWRFNLHYFEWLGDLAAVGGDRAGQRARALIADWIANHSRPGLPAWHPYPLSVRLYAWMRHAQFVLEGADDSFRRQFFASLDRQARHLARVVEWDVGGNHLIKNLKALVAAGHCLAGHERHARCATAALRDALEIQILADGGHYERSPSYHLQVLCDLVDVRTLLADADAAEAWLGETISRMAAALATFRLGDGGLVLFNDGDIGDEALLEAIERRLGGLSEPPPVLAQTGYVRMQRADAIVIMDAGRCCPDDLPAHAHADTLAFEFSSGPRRIVVNCGTFAYQDGSWRNRLRGTAAHSTVGIDEDDSAEVYGTFRLGRRPRKVVCERTDDEVGALAGGSHDGYGRYGLVHHRRLVLANDGRRLSGVDRIERVRRDPARRLAAARFHLHPDVAVAPGDRDDKLRLSLPGQELWSFAAPGESVRVAESVYAPRFGEMRASRQIVVEKPLETSDTILEWEFVESGGA